MGKQLDLFHIAERIPFPPACQIGHIRKLANQIADLEPQRLQTRIRQETLQVRRRLYAAGYKIEVVEPLAIEFERTLVRETRRYVVMSALLQNHGGAA